MATEQEIKEHAAKVAASWDSDWGIYLPELARLTGLTLEQVMLWDMLLTWRDTNEMSRTNIAKVAEHMKRCEGEDDEWKPKT